MKRGFNKKGQITIFIILGLVLLIFALFVMYIENTKNKNALDNKAAEVNSEYERLGPYKYLVESCLETVSNEAFYLLGQQGGVLYDYQGGLTSTNYFLPLDQNVSYGVFYNFSKIPYAKIPPIYPHDMFDSNQSTIAYFGDNKIPIMCQAQGVNYKEYYSINSKNKSIICESYSNTSIQKELEAYITNNMNVCVNISKIPEFASYRITLKSPETEVLFAENDVKISIKYPITIQLGEGDDETRYLDFKKVVRVRFKKIHSLAYRIAQNDAKDISFQKNNNTEINKKLKPYLDSYIELNVNCPLCHLNIPTDIVTIKDTASTINGGPFIFRFASDNRAPALDYIKTRSQYISSPYYPTRKYDMILFENQTITINPVANDPDEDDITYTYEGWKEDYDSYFELSCCIGYGVAATVDCKADYFTCVKKNQNKSHYWTKSNLYQSTRRSASYTIQKSDLGEHTLIVKATDAHNVSDWQEIKIMVFDKPQASAGHTNRFDDIDQKYGSSEDLYLLNTTGSASIFGDINYYWTDEYEPFRFNITNPVTYIPENANIDQMTNMMFSKNGIHKISLTVSNQIMSDTEFFFLDVRKCLAHFRNHSAPYPYNNLGFDNSQGYYNDTTDNFMASHTCCEANTTLNDFVYAPYDKLCYDYYEYGSYMSFNRSLFLNQALGDFTYQPGQADIYLNRPKKNDNDIFIRKYNRTCGEEIETRQQRGNICDGKITETYEVIEECKDITLDEFGNPNLIYTKRCSGPPGMNDDYEIIFPNTGIYSKLNLFNKQATSGLTTKPICVNYTTGDTFEEFEASPTSTNFSYCGENLRCSSYNFTAPTDERYIYNDPLGGPFGCYGGCDGLGGCTRGTGCVCNSTICAGYGGDPACDGRVSNNGNTANFKSGKCDKVHYIESVCDDNCQTAISMTYSNNCKVTGDPTCYPDLNVNFGTLLSNTIACDNKPRNYPLYYTNSGLGCEGDCTAVNCTPYLYNPNIGRCSDTICNQDSQCANGYRCDPVNSECILLN